MRNGLFFATTAVVEITTGLALLAVPDLVGTLLLGVDLDMPGALVVVRIAGAALLAMGLACWMARADAQSRAARGILAAMLLYNTMAAVVLAYAALRSHTAGVGLWPAVLAHCALGAWCIGCLRNGGSASREV